MKMAFRAAFVLAVAALWLGSCTKEKIVAPVIPQATVSGVVNAWWCGIGDCVNNTGDVRYTVHTGRSATVKFVREGNCCTTFGGTDDSSVYEIRTAKGNYFIVVETPYAHPDTLYGVTLTADTVIDLDFVYETQTPDTIGIWCEYASPDDTLDQSVELAAIRDFNQWIGDMLDVDSMGRRTYTLSPPEIIMEYRVPVRPAYAPWQVEEKAQDLWAALMPDNMSFTLDGYICLD
jgi:hypothetical protein